MLFDSLAFAGTPVQWAFLILVALLILSPRTLPMLARRFGDVFILSALRRVVPFKLPDRAARPPRHEMRVIEEEKSPPAVIVEPPDRTANHRALWATGLIVTSSAAVLLWFLLHSR